MENRLFRKVLVVVVLVPFLAVMLFSMGILFGVPATVLYCVFTLVGFKLYDIYEEKQRQKADRQWHAELRDWQETMRQNGWREKGDGDWQMKDWVVSEDDYFPDMERTDEELARPSMLSSSNARKHRSSVVLKKRKVRRK